LYKENSKNNRLNGRIAFNSPVFDQWFAIISQNWDLLLTIFVRIISLLSLVVLCILIKRYLFVEKKKCLHDQDSIENRNFQMDDGVKSVQELELSVVVSHYPVLEKYQAAEEHYSLLL
jgi:hypothetical protein